MKYLGLDLGTKSLGVAISDSSGILASPVKLISFSHEDYDSALRVLLEIINKEKITEVVLGLPKNMDNSLGFASNRSMNFKKLLEDNGIIVHLEDERLTSMEAINIMKNNNIKKINQTKKTDIISACLILESFLKRKAYEKQIDNR